MYRRVIDEHTIPGRRLGRNVKHDPRSLRYPYRSSTPLVSVRHECHIPTLDQGDLGSCTGNATVHALASGTLYWSTLTPDQQSSLNEAQAVAIYSLATTLDDYNGTYPPTDTGSDGLDVAKAATNLGFINGYTHALSLNDTLAALVHGPVIVGVDWYSTFDEPKPTGEMPYGGYARGGHEVCLDQIDVENSRVWMHNSWSDAWGVQGRAWWSFDTLGRLLSSDGDATVFVPLTAPTPTPIPADGVQQAMVDAGVAWEKSIVSQFTKAGKFKAAFDAWRATL